MIKALGCALAWSFSRRAPAAPKGPMGPKSLQWHHNEPDGVSNHQPYDCLLNRVFRCRSKKASKLRVTGLCLGNSPGPVNSPHKGPVTRKMFPFDDVIMSYPRYVSAITGLILGFKTISKPLDLRQGVQRLARTQFSDFFSDQFLSFPGHKMYCRYFVTASNTGHRKVHVSCSMGWTSKMTEKHGHRQKPLFSVIFCHQRAELGATWPRIKSFLKTQVYRVELSD